MDGRFAFGRRIEAPLYRVAGVNAEHEMGWLRYALGLLSSTAWACSRSMRCSACSVAAAEPAGHGRVTPDSSFNTAVSFVTNTNWQGYGGEATMSYLTQMLGLAVQNFFSAATGIVVVIALIRGFARHTAQEHRQRLGRPDARHAVDPAAALVRVRARSSCSRA